MAIGALLIPTFLSHASTNLFAVRATEEGLKELYAADSGVEYVLLQLKNGDTSGSHSYTINDRSVVVTWDEHEYITETYGIVSTATILVDGSSTTIESGISLNMLDYLWLFDNAITTSGDIEIGPNSKVSGNVYHNDADPDIKGD